MLREGRVINVIINSNTTIGNGNVNANIEMSKRECGHLQRGCLREKLASERNEKDQYAKKVGQLTMQVDWLKKIRRNAWT